MIEEPPLRGVIGGPPNFVNWETLTDEQGPNVLHELLALAGALEASVCVAWRDQHSWQGLKYLGMGVAAVLSI